MKFRLRDTPIQRKLTMVILCTSSFALLLMGSSLITYEMITFRRSLVVNMGVLAQIIGSNSTAALAFDDRKNAQEILRALAVEHQVTAAAIYDQQGALFASFPEDKTRSDFPTRPGADGYAFESAHFRLFHPIRQDGKHLGTIFVRADLGEMYSRLMVYGTLLGLVAACSFLGALLLSRVFAAPYFRAHPRTRQSRNRRLRASGLFRPRSQTWLGRTGPVDRSVQSNADSRGREQFRLGRKRRAFASRA